MSRFFIDRPIFAWVFAVIVCVAGAISIMRLPVAQYPSVAPPAVSISANYPGASAKTVEDSVTQIIEQQMSGLDNLRYIESSSDSAGAVRITLTFNTGTDPDIAQVQVQNKLQGAIPLLPQEVQNQGVRATKSVNNTLMVVGLVSEDGSMSSADLNDYLYGTLKDPISRVTGVGNFNTFGAQYSMRVWVDPAKLMQFQLTTADLTRAIQSQNAHVSSGSLGAAPAEPGRMLDAAIVTGGRFETADQFGEVVIKGDSDGSRVLLRDVARVELGSENYGSFSRYNGKPSAGFAIQPASGANAIETVNAVKEKLDELSAFFPKGLRVIYPYDTTPFVKHSIQEVIKTLVEAIILVFLVIFVFLGNFRATLIPTITIPVVLLGTFGVLAAAGFSINTLTLLGLVLAIGLLVDDAIVVVENVERVMKEEGLSPREATRKSMNQISGALVGIGLVLCSAFIPMAFFGNSTGVIYRQFAVTVGTSVALSVFMALILTPALCATLLKPSNKDSNQPERGLLGWFNRGFDRISDKYALSVSFILKRSLGLLAVYAGIVIAVVFMFRDLPAGFLPDEDKGSLMVMAQLPPGATVEQSSKALEKIEQVMLEDLKDSVEGVFGVVGFSFSGAGQNQVACFVHLKDWTQRTSPDQSVKAVQGRAMAEFMKIKEAMVFAMFPAAVQELSNTNGFDLRLVDTAGHGHETLVEAQNQLIAFAAKEPVLQGVRANSVSDKAELHLDLDVAKASSLGLSIAEVNVELANIFGSRYVNDFIDRGRVKKVYLQGDGPYRMSPEDIGRWHVRNREGAMVPLSAITRASWAMGSPKLSRFNGMSSVAISGQAAPGHSSGEAMRAMEEIAKRLPPGIGFEWAGISFEERSAGSSAFLLYGLALLMVFLCLAALYENWAIPAAVLMDMPLGAIGVLGAMVARDLSNDIYFQIGLITIIGLSAKNAILVIEFAKQRFDDGEDLITASVHAVRQRLRPILMTSIAFGLGVLPLALSSGPGAGSQNAVGTGVVGGALTTTLLGLFFIPFYFVTVMRLFRVKPKGVRTTRDRNEVGVPMAAHNGTDL